MYFIVSGILFQMRGKFENVSLVFDLMSQTAFRDLNKQLIAKTNTQTC